MNSRASSNPSKITELFENNKKFIEELIKENERLRLVNESLRTDIRELEDEHKLDKPSLKERIRFLEDENTVLRQELGDIKQQFNAIEKENCDFSKRYMQVENQNNSLLNLYVATQRLHSALGFKDALEALKEIVISMIGSESFAIFLYDSRYEKLKTIASMGTNGAMADDPLTNAIVAETVQSGDVQIQKPETRDTSSIAACMPMKIDGQVLGVIVLYQLLYHKSEFNAIDYELFDVIGSHAMTVLLSSFCFSKSNALRDTASMSGFIDEITETKLREIA